MALTIKMRIDEQPEHSYVFSTGDGGEIELIPLSVVANGSYTAPDGKAYNIVTVNVPETELDTLNITENGTYNAPDGTAYNIVTVDVEPILEAVSRTYSANGTYTIAPSSGKDGISGVTVVVDVPTPSPNLQSKSESYSANGTYSVTPDTGYDGLSEVSVTVNVSGGGGVSNVDYEQIDTADMNTGAQNLIELRANETVKGIYIFNDLPDLGSVPNVNALIQFSACRNSMGSSNYDFCVNVETDDGTAQHTTTNSPITNLDYITVGSSSDLDIIAVYNGYLQGFVLDPNVDTGGYGLSGVYNIVVIYENVT